MVLANNGTDQYPLYDDSEPEEIVYNFPPLSRSTNGSGRYHRIHKFDTPTQSSSSSSGYPTTEAGYYYPDYTQLGSSGRPSPHTGDGYYPPPGVGRSEQYPERSYQSPDGYDPLVKYKTKPPAIQNDIPGASRRITLGSLRPSIAEQQGNVNRTSMSFPPGSRQGGSEMRMNDTVQRQTPVRVDVKTALLGTGFQDPSAPCRAGQASNRDARKDPGIYVGKKFGPFALAEGIRGLPGMRHYPVPQPFGDGTHGQPNKIIKKHEHWDGKGSTISRNGRCIPGFCFPFLHEQGKKAWHWSFRDETEWLLDRWCVEGFCYPFLDGTPHGPKPEQGHECWDGCGKVIPAEDRKDCKDGHCYPSIFMDMERDNEDRRKKKKQEGEKYYYGQEYDGRVGR
ncbi:hypothetical protein QBC37DRAFT_407068 [Rhypophila decipiens]|uniref:Uncharacterized protein n=1 Tax=Rhypophila decipiens TaxID=261697 RepID=A0AAN7B340_9PEZI|nr:hypothetical protein QBC37DRAFT_407068 [Rhypophila decipiens]